MDICIIWDYVSQESTWSSTSGTCRREYKHAASNVFARYTRKLLYVLLDFQVTERLHQGPDVSHNYLIGYLIGFIIGFIIDYNIIS